MSSWLGSSALVGVMFVSIIGPFALGVLLSLAVVGKRLRHQWFLVLLVIALPLLCFAVFVFLSGGWYYQNARFAFWLLARLPPGYFAWVVVLVLAAMAFRRAMARWSPKFRSSGRAASARRST
jgi:hypothetical protein